MSYFLWGCRGILTLITLRSERVNKEMSRVLCRSTCEVVEHSSFDIYPKERSPTVVKFKWYPRSHLRPPWKLKPDRLCTRWYIYYSAPAYLVCTRSTHWRHCREDCISQATLGQTHPSKLLDKNVMSRNAVTSCEPSLTGKSQPWVQVALSAFLQIPLLCFPSLLFSSISLS